MASNDLSELVVFIFTDRYQAREVLNELRRRDGLWLQGLDWANGRLTMDESLPPQVGKLQSKAAEVAAEWIAPRAEEVDRDCLWPEHSMQVLAQDGFMGCMFPAPSMPESKY